MEDKCNRLGIYHIYDKFGVIDDYIPYMLKNISSHLKDLYIVCNGCVCKKELKKLEAFTDNVIVRENLGFDAGGFKCVLTEHLSLEKLKEYDELLLFNDSFFGPIDTFDEVFGIMAKKKVDFWTLTNTKGNEYSKASIQSYFINIKRRLLHSEDFISYWKNLPYFRDFTETIIRYEESFAEYFEGKGYISAEFINNEDYFWGKEQCNISPYHDFQYELMAYQKYPIIKKKIFALDPNSDSYGADRQGKEQFIQAFEYIKTKKNYKTKLIWENILRCYSLREIQESCCLREVLPNIECEYNAENKAVIFLALRDRNINYDNIRRLRKKKVHVVLISDSNKILHELDNDAFFSREVHLAFSTEEVIKIIHDRTIKLENRYKYCCFISDFYWQKGKMPYTVGASKLWEDWENIIGKGAYIDHVIKLFEENMECGLLVSPRPFHAHYFGERGEYVEFEKIKCRQFVEQNGLREYICRSRKKAWWSNSFWTRLSLLKNVLEKVDGVKEKVDSWEYFDSLCEILPYWYQYQGYYTEIICSERFARTRYTIEENCMETLMAQLKKIVEFSTYRDLQILLKLYLRNIDSIYKFILGHKKVYIYGAGEIAKALSCLHCLDNVSCFIVSDGYEKQKMLNNRAVKYLSEIELEISDGIILGLNKEHAHQVISLLQKMNIENDILKIEDEGMFDGGWLNFST